MAADSLDPKEGRPLSWAEHDSTDMTEASYAQFGEDVLVWEYFSRKASGCFVEVGAHEPRDLSQTMLLEEKGWKGILIEPLAVLSERLRQQRPGSQVFQVACSSPQNRGEARFFVSDHLELSSLEKWKNDLETQYAQTETVRVMTLDDVLEQAGVGVVDFVSIDVEGTELDVLRGFNLKKYQPALLLVEDHLYHLGVHRWLTREQYRLVKRTGCNNWYIPRHAAFPHQTLGERAALFRKVWLGTPLRALRLSVRRLFNKAAKPGA